MFRDEDDLWYWYDRATAAIIARFERDMKGRGTFCGSPYWRKFQDQKCFRLDAVNKRLKRDLNALKGKENESD